MRMVQKIARLKQLNFRVESMIKSDKEEQCQLVIMADNPPLPEEGRQSGQCSQHPAPSACEGQRGQTHATYRIRKLILMTFLCPWAWQLHTKFHAYEKPKQLCPII